jgi:hypothetical protein
MHIHPGAATITDIPAGRLLVEHAASTGGLQMALAPGTANNITTAVNQMVPSDREWHSRRRIG